MTQAWHLAQLKPNGLDRALTNLSRQGFESFVPRQAQQSIRRGRAQNIETPLFPGYVFIRFDPVITQWRVINNTYGVNRLVATRPNHPDQVPDTVIEALQGRCDAEGLLLPPGDLAPGDRVRILSGPFADWVTEIVAMQDDQRVMVLLSLLGEANRTSLPISSVQKL